MIREWNTPQGKISAMSLKDWCGQSNDTRMDTEKMLDKGMLYAETRKDTLWQLRRNGATKTWKRDPLRFEIPVKGGFRDCFRIQGGSGYLTNHLWVKVNKEAEA